MGGGVESVHGVLRRDVLFYGLLLLLCLKDGRKSVCKRVASFLFCRGICYMDLV